MDLVKAGIALLRLDTTRVGMRLKAKWIATTFPYGMDYRDEVERFDRLYLLPDPWSLDCERERFRFEETNRLILDNLGHSGSLLEIGCGEGLQSSELLKVCNHLHGIDISRRATLRARRRCPQATFAVTDLYGLSLPTPATRFDLVTACEVLYYMADVTGALKRLSELGRACLISYCDNVRQTMDVHVKVIPGVRFETISYEDLSWTLAWWRP